MLSGRGCEREGATASVPSRWFFGFRRFFFFFLVLWFHGFASFVVARFFSHTVSRCTHIVCF